MLYSLAHRQHSFFRSDKGWRPEIECRSSAVRMFNPMSRAIECAPERAFVMHPAYGRHLLSKIEASRHHRAIAQLASQPYLRVASNPLDAFLGSNPCNNLERRN